MQIILNQTEIEDAVRSYVLGQIAIREDQEISIDFKATRGDEGMTALIAITKMEPVVEEPVVQQPRTRARKATSTTSETPATQKPSEPATSTSESSSSEQQANDQPVTEEPAAATEPTSSQEEVTTQVDPADVQRATAAPKIFGDGVSSAPLTASPASNEAAKSLFANLTKPTHDARPN